jgi:hypothetical protein
MPVKHFFNSLLGVAGKVAVVCVSALLGAVSGLLLALALLFVAHWVSGGRGFMATFDALILFGLGSIVSAVSGAVSGMICGAAFWEWLQKPPTSCG